MRLFKNGQIARADSTELNQNDVLVGDDGIIVEIGESISPDRAGETIDCSGCILVPGMFDLHVHGREPGHEDDETLATCAAAALHGGVTGLVLMPDTSPAIDTANLVKSVQDLIEESSPIPMFQAGSLTKGREGEKLAGFSGMVARGVPMLTDSDRSISSPGVLRRCMEYAADLGVVVGSYCDTPALKMAGAVNEGHASYRLGLPGAPAISQEICIDRDIRLARYTGARLHLQQISTSHGVASVGAAKVEGSRITCEVSPQHLLLSEDDIVSYDTSFKFDPPLRAKEDCDALLAGLLDDSIDIIATNHAPHSDYAKSADFASAPWGVSGLETAVLCLYDRFIESEVFGWDLLIRKYSDAPRELVGQPVVSIGEGEDANFFVFDPSCETQISSDYLRTKSPAGPFLGKTLQGAMRGTAFGALWSV